MSRLDPVKPTLTTQPSLSSIGAPRLATTSVPPPKFELKPARAIAGSTTNNHIRRIEELREADQQTQPCIEAVPIDKKKLKAEAANFARSIVESKDYRMSVRLRAANGVLPPAIEAMLWAYAYGQPRDKMERPVEELRGRKALEAQSSEELAERAARIASGFTEAAQHAKGQCADNCSLCVTIEAEVVQ